MNISWYGLNCFEIQGKNIIIVLDPKEDSKIGFKPPSFKADIVCLNNSQEQTSKLKPRQERVFLISAPGEYEIGGVFIYSFFYPDEKNLVCRLQIEGMNIAHLGNLGKILDDAILEKLDRVDILMIPVGGDAVLNAEKALEVINQIEPKLVIPMHYKIPGLNLKLDSVDKFCREIGETGKELAEKLKISKKDLEAEKFKTIIMKNI